MKTIYLSLGSNLGDKATYLKRAIEHLEEFFIVSSLSSVYETEPIDYTDQDFFLNQVIKMESDKDISEIFQLTKDIEKSLDRTREIKYGPRTIDIDILLYESEVISTPELTIPHPRMRERRFVLEPLLEISDDPYIPPDNEKASYYLSRVKDQMVKKYQTEGIIYEV